MDTAAESLERNSGVADLAAEAALLLYHQPGPRLGDNSKDCANRLRVRRRALDGAKTPVKARRTSTSWLPLSPGGSSACSTSVLESASRSIALYPASRRLHSPLRA